MNLPPDALHENVYAFALARDQVESYCNQCLTSMAELKKCSACRRLAYCSQECQRADWKLHKVECKAIKVGDFMVILQFISNIFIFQTHNEVANDSIRLVMRIAGKLSRNEDGEIEAYYIPGVARNFQNLEHHPSSYDADEESFVKEYFQFAIAPHPDRDLIKLIFQKVSINSFVVGNSTGNPIGVGLCIKLSAANHSCKPLTRVCYR